MNTSQTITVTGVNDTIIDGDISSTITLTANDANSDDNFDSLDNKTVSVLTTNDDSAGFTIAESDSTTVVTEAGSTDTFTVVLDAKPDSDVVIDISSLTVGEISYTPSFLTFTPSNWNTTQTITITGIDDNRIDGDTETTVILTVDDSASG